MYMDYNFTYYGVSLSVDTLHDISDDSFSKKKIHSFDVLFPISSNISALSFISDILLYTI